MTTPGDGMFRAWVESELRRLEAHIGAIKDTAIATKAEQTRHNIELNDVRHRFISREAFEVHVTANARDREADRHTAAARWRTFVVTIMTMGLTILALAVTVISLLAR